MNVLAFACIFVCTSFLYCACTSNPSRMHLHIQSAGDACTFLDTYVSGGSWSTSKDLEGCSEQGTWAPVRVCDRRCGFSQPKLPEIRSYSRGGELDCSDTVCTQTCDIRPNLINSPVLTKVFFCCQIMLGGVRCAWSP